MSQFNRATVGNAARTPRAAIYCRVSSAGQEDNSSLGTQEAACRSYAAERGWVVVEVYREVHTGAELFERPQLTALRDAMRHGGFDVLVVHALDRLSRKQTHQGLILAEAEHAGVEWDSVTEDIDNSPTGQILRAVIGGMAEMERLKIGERTMRGRRARVEAGKYPGVRRPPYGYAWADDARERLVQEHMSSAIVRRIFRELAAGTSARAVARGLTAEGVPTPAGKDTWSPTTVIAIVNHPIYVGRPVAWRWRKEHVKGRGTRQVERPMDQQIALPGAAPALVCDDLAAAAREQLSINKWRAVRNNRNPQAALLRAGLGRCGYCGGYLNAVNHYRSGTNYRCGNGQRDRYGCPGFSIKAAILDAAAWSRAEAILKRPDIISAEVERLRRNDPTAADLAAVDRRLADVERKQRRYVKLVGDTDEPDVVAHYQAELGFLASQKRQLDEERTGLLRQREGWRLTQEGLDNIEAWCRSVAANLSELDYDHKRLALEALGVEARVWAVNHQPRYEITMNIDIVSAPTGSC